MGQKYRQISLEERIEIARLSGEGHSLRAIAAALDRAPSSIAREIKRNRGAQVGYKPTYAHDLTRARRWTGSKLDRDPELRARVLGQLTAGWSPEQIAGRARRDGTTPICHETIYRFIYAQIDRHNDFSWRQYLPRAKSRRGWRATRGGSPALLMKGRIPIAARPSDIAARLTPGHWEADLMAFSRSGQNILMIHERMSRVLIGCRLPTKFAGPVAQAIGAALETLPSALRQTMTFDNGTEFARHYELARIGLDTYFCDPHAPWQKGGIENAIGRMRRPLPRKTDIAELSTQAFNDVILWYNNTPRKCLGYQTPAEVLENLLHFKCESTPRPAPG